MEIDTPAAPIDLPAIPYDFDDLCAGDDDDDDFVVETGQPRWRRGARLPRRRSRRRPAARRQYR